MSTLYHHVEIKEIISEESLFTSDVKSSINLLYHNLHKSTYDMDQTYERRVIDFGNKTPRLTDLLSREGLVYAYNKTLELIKEVIKKFIQWLKDIWNKSELFLLYNFKYFLKMSDEFRYVRNKYKIKLSERSIKLFKEYFPTINLNEADDEMKLLTTFSDNFLKSIKSFLENKQPLSGKYYDFKNEYKSFTIDSEFNLETFDLNKPTKSINIPNEANFLDVFEFSKGYDSLLFGIKDFKNKINQIETLISNNVTRLSNINNPDLKDIKLLNLLGLIQSKLLPKHVNCYINTINGLSKFLKSALKDAISSTSLGYYVFLDLYKNNSDFNKEFKFKDDIGDPNKLKVIDNGDILYIEFEAPNPSRTGPAFNYNDCLIEKITFTDEYGKLQQARENYFDFNPFRVSLIFIDRKALESDKHQLDFNTTYWHEVGHVVTNQQEIVYHINQTNFYDSFLNVVERYIGHQTENQADAFAKLKTGVSWDKLWEFRLHYLLKSAAMTMGTYKYYNTINLEEYTKWREGISKRKQEYINNVTKEIQDMGKYTKLGALGWLRKLTI